VALAADPNAFPQLQLAPWAVLEHDVVVPSGSQGGEQIAVPIDPQAKRTALRAHASQSFSLERAIKDPGTTETWNRFQARAPTGLLDDTKGSSSDTIALTASEPPLAKLLKSGDAAVQKLYHARPIEQIHKETTARPIARKQITALIDKQMSALGPLTAAQKKNLQRLQEDGTGVVVTGQQTGVLGGPLYSLFKALGAVNHAASLSERGVPAVPVFWLASYDSDLKEVQDMKAVGAGDPKSLTLGKKLNEHPVGEQTLGAGIDKMLGELRAVLEETHAPHIDDAMKLAHECFTADSTFAGGFSKLIFELTKQHGLLILDPNAREFSQLAKPVLERELFAPTGSKGAIDVANAELDKLGLKPQVHGNTDRLNVFFVDDNGKRVFLSRDADGNFSTGGTPSKLTAAEVKTLIDASPERFTPSALLRPVVEDQVLPTLTYVGGPSEVSYFAQIGGVYDWAKVPMPSVETRPSFAFAAKKDVAALEGATGLGIDALLAHEAPLALIGRAGLPPAVRAAYDALAAVRDEVGQAASAAEKLASARDFDGLLALQSSLSSKVERALDDVLAAVKAAGLERAEKGVSFARDKVQKPLLSMKADVERAKTDKGFTPQSSHFGKVFTELRGLDDQAVKVGRQTRPDLVAAFQKLKPGNEPQERTMTIVQLVAELGLDAADAFLGLAQVGQAGRTLVTVD
ncbi:MAG TPA: bacillithiol biosynthesis cysteine-adding enzyme BshC, partial [Myxococcota bacterium]